MPVKNSVKTLRRKDFSSSSQSHPVLSQDIYSYILPSGSAHMLLAQGTSPYFKAAPAAHKLSNLTMAQLPFSAPAAGLLAVRKRVSSTTSEDRQKKQCRSFML